MNRKETKLSKNSKTEKNNLPEENSAAVKPFYKKPPFWIIISAAVVIFVLLMVTFLDYSIIASGIKTACKPRKISVPSNYEEIAREVDAVYDVAYDSEYGNALFDIYTPKGKSGKNPLVLYIHGGYYLGGDKKSAEPYCKVIAAEGYTVVSMNYGLAPKYHYPVQLKQVNELLKFLVSRSNEYRVDETQIFIGGDSAGAHLAATAGAFYTNDTLALKINTERSIKGGAIKGLLLLCGFYNTDTVKDCKFPFFDTAMWAFTDVRNYKNYGRIEELNVVANVTKNYPSAFVTCGGGDPFYSQAKELIDVLKTNKVSYVEYLPENKNLKHEFQRDFSTEEGNAAMEKALRFLKSNSTITESETREIHALFTLQDGDEEVVFDVLLDEKHAPLTVANFIEYAEAGFYDGTVFHIILKNAVLQGGGYILDERGEYKEKTTRPAIKGEFSSNGYYNNTISHLTGVISMARSDDKNSATSQFFFCVGDQSYYDGQYAGFGRIVNRDGLIALMGMTAVDSSQVVNPPDPIVLKSVKIDYRYIK